MSNEKVKFHAPAPYDDIDNELIEFDAPVRKKSKSSENQIYKIMYGGGDCYPLRKSDYEQLVASEDREILINSSVYIPSSHTLVYFDSNGYKSSAANGVSADAAANAIDFTSHTDPWGNNIDSEEDIQEDKIDSSKATYTFDHIHLMLSNPRKYRKSNFISLNVLNLLITTMVLDPDQFDEIFTVEESVPESPLLRNYMRKLAELSLEEMAANKGSLSEDYLETLGKQAYEFAGYEGKTLDTVNEEAKDYTNYMRFLLTKGDNIVISEQERNLAYKFRRNLEEDRWLDVKLGSIGKKSRNVQVVQELPSIKDNLFSTAFPLLRKNGNNITVYHFVGSLDKELKDFDFEKDNLHLRMAMANELLLKKYAETAKLKVETYVIVCDKNANYTEVFVRHNSLNKWKKEFYTLLTAFIDKLENPSDVRPYGAPIEI